MDEFGLVSWACNFAPFVALEELNLSGNMITDVVPLNLQVLPLLKALDLSKNQITVPIAEV